MTYTPLHNMKHGEIKRRLGGFETVSFSYNDLLGEWDRRRSVFRDRCLIAFGIVGGIAQIVSLGKTAGWWFS